MSDDIRPSLQMIAKNLGYSTATISRALRGMPGQSEATRQKVADEARRLGYAQHPMITALMTDLRFKRKSKAVSSIALAHCQPPTRQPTRNLAIFRERIKSRSERLGYVLEDHYLDDPKIAPGRLVEILKTRGVRGIIFEHYPRNDVELDIDLSGLCAVSIGFTLTKPNLHRVAVDYYSGVSTAWERLTELGYQRIGLAISEENEAFTRFRRMAALHVMQRDLPPGRTVPAFTYNASHEPDEERGRFREWLHDYRPDVVVSNLNAPHAMLGELGYSIPDDIGFAHLDKCPDDDHLAGIKPHWEVVASHAVNLLLDQIYRNDFAPPAHPLISLVEGEWIDGPSAQRKAGHKAGR